MQRIKERKKLYFILIILLVLVASLSIAYSVLSVTLNITGSAEVKNASWDIRFENIKVTKGSVPPTKKPTIKSPTEIEFDVTLNKPGDFYEFTVDLVNKGSIDAMIDSITKIPELTQSQQKYLIYNITYKDDNPIATKQLLKKDLFKTIKVKVAYKTDLTESDLPIKQETLNLGFQGVFV